MGIRSRNDRHGSGGFVGPREQESSYEASSEEQIVGQRRTILSRGVMKGKIV